MIYNTFMIAAFLFLHGFVVECQQQQPKLLSRRNQCGKWNSLADIDCTGAPRLNVQYTREMHSLQMRLIHSGITPEEHYELVAKNQSYALASKMAHFAALETRNGMEIQEQQQSQNRLRRRLDPTLTLPVWTNIPSGQLPSSKGGTTYAAEVNTADYVITSASGGTVLTFSACGTGSAGDTYLRLVDTATGKQLAFDDDSCGTSGGGSLLTYTVPGPSTSSPTMTFKIGCFSTSTCRATVVITGISALNNPTSSPTRAPTNTRVPTTITPTRMPTCKPTTATPSSIIPTVIATPVSQFPVNVTGWYQYAQNIGLGSAKFLPLGLNTLLPDGKSILYYVTCSCARYRWGDVAKTFITDSQGFPLIHLVANRTPKPSIKPTSSPSYEVTAIPTALPSEYSSAVPTFTSAPSISIAPSTEAPSSIPLISSSTRYLPLVGMSSMPVLE